MSPVGEAIAERRAELISEAIEPLAAAQTIRAGPRRTQHCLVACGWQSCRKPPGKSTVKKDWQAQNVRHARAVTPSCLSRLETEQFRAENNLPARQLPTSVAIFA